MATLTERLRDCLNAILEEVEGKEDVVDSSDNRPAPNDYMTIGEEAREALALLNRMGTNANT